MLWFLFIRMMIFFMLMFLLMLIFMSIIMIESLLLWFRYSNLFANMSLLLNCWNIRIYVCNNSGLLLPNLGNNNIFRMGCFTWLLISFIFYSVACYVRLLLNRIGMMFMWLLVVNMLFFHLLMFIFILIRINGHHLFG